MASIVERRTSRGDRRLYVTFRATDRATGKTKKIWLLEPTGLVKEAKARKAEVETGLRRSGGIWPLTAPSAAVPTFDEYSQLWLDTRARYSVSERVFDHYRGILRRDLSPTFGQMPLDQIRRRDINDMLVALAASGKAHNTIRNILIPLRKMLNDAVDDELITANPTLRVKIPAFAPIQETVVPTTEQLELILGAATAEAREAIAVVAALGLRRGEAFALRWRDIDFNEELVDIKATNHRGQILDRTKTKAGTRLVPLFESARKILLARRLRLSPERTRPEAFVFGNEAGDPLDPGNWYRHAWLPALAAADVGHFHFHALRHFAATRLDEQGMGSKLRTEIIGHSDERITNAVYTHIGRACLTAAAKAFDPLVAGW